ncbi:MAG: M20 family metallopeptidase [Thermomicrobiales bacterium]|nr:M20 family metallopeptidase [Thermomicrobiales bacterium]MCO5221104.1 M20 family metallopeptidase [Thermomicrobiales bacterium]
MTEDSSKRRLGRDEIIEMASELIAIPSPTGTEVTIMTWVTEWCDRHGLSYEVFTKDPAQPNVVISVGNDDGPTLVMNGHLDTVPVSDPDAWISGPYEPRLSDDGKKLYGRGASDMKASTGIMMLMCKLFKDTSLQGRLQAHVVSDEEMAGSKGTVFLMEEIEAGRLIKPDYCLIGEKSDLKVRNAERGLFQIEIVFHGRASHTAAARVTGINAIAKAAKGILALEGDIDKFHPSVGKPVISINMIEAGVAHNVVPGEAKIHVDRRLIPGETRESVVAEIREKLDAVAAGDPDFKYTLIEDPHGDFIPANITEEDSPLVQAVQQAVRDELGREPEFFVAWAGATDGRFYRQHGIDTVGFGPGGENAHGANEAGFVDDLVAEADVYAATIEQLLIG